MMSFSCVTLLLSLCCLLERSNAFLTSSGVLSTRQSLLAAQQQLPSPEESAKQLTEYMAKSHEEKLRAVREAEQKKEAEIQALRKELEEVKQHGGSSSSSSLTTTTTTQLPQGSPSADELTQKLLSYQQFMSQYIVRAQEEKVRAIKAAENAIKSKYELLLSSSSASSISTPPAAITTSPSSASTNNNKLYMDRNARVWAAGKAGKSRWGDMETQRAAAAVLGSSPVPAPVKSMESTVVNGAVIVNGAPPAPPSVAAASSQPNKPKATLSWPPPEVVNADHGLRADGGVGGPTLADRVKMGASVAGPPAAAAPAATTASSAAPVLSRNHQLYLQRNAMISAAAKVGKSRWGSMETEKASKLSNGMSLAGGATAATTPTITLTPEIEKADHGLRADGGVGGPSLAERVNLGAQLLQQKKSNN